MSRRICSPSRDVMSHGDWADEYASFPHGFLQEESWRASRSRVMAQHEGSNRVPQLAILRNLCCPVRKSTGLGLPRAVPPKPTDCRRIVSRAGTFPSAQADPQNFAPVTAVVISWGSGGGWCRALLSFISGRTIVKRLPVLLSVVVLGPMAGCAATQQPSQPFEWELIPLQVGGQNSSGGGSILLNKRTGETWGQFNGEYVPMPRRSSSAQAAPVPGAATPQSR